MKNLWFFILKYHAFFLFIVFETAAILILINNNNYQQATAVNSANNFFGSIYSSYSNLTDYFNLRSTNDSLAFENQQLRNQINADFYDNNVVSKTRTDSLLLQQYTYMNAKVVNNTTAYRNNYITLNRGSKHGVKKGMGVIANSGVVGIVKDVSEHFCTVISLLHKDTRISAQLFSTKDIGSLIWEGVDPRKATLVFIPNHVEVTVGDKVTTTGFSLFPEGILIGIVTSSEIKSGESFIDVDVYLSTDFQNLRYVYIVENKLALEQQKLESKLKND